MNNKHRPKSSAKIFNLSAIVNYTKQLSMVTQPYLHMFV